MLRCVDCLQRPHLVRGGPAFRTNLRPPAPHPAGWQLLAQQVAADNGGSFRTARDDVAGEAGPSSSSGGGWRDPQAPPPHQPSPANGVATRPHQWLYREYKLLEQIGSGGFGSVHTWVAARRGCRAQIAPMQLRPACSHPHQRCTPPAWQQQQQQ
jgi:hypothetical protein